MSVDIADQTSPLTKVDSAVSGLSSSPPKEKGHRRASSSVTGVWNINELGKFPVVVCMCGSKFEHCCMLGIQLVELKLISRAEKEGKELEIAPETQKLNW